MVRFHDQVQVKKIKATGKNRPLSAPDEAEHFRGSAFTDLLVDADADDDDDDDFDDDEDEDEDEEEHNFETASDDDIDDIGRRVTMDRVKDDLFAEDARDKEGRDCYTVVAFAYLC